jgi:hypothetical protein
MLKQTYCPEFQTVQCAFKDSMIHGSAIHTTFRVLLRSSSLREPRDPLLKVVFTRCVKRLQSKRYVLVRQPDRAAEAAPAPADSGQYSSQYVKGSPLVMIHPQVHLRIPCYDLYFL